MKRLLFAALLIGCGTEPTPKLERLEVAPISGLATHQNGKVFHPWRVDLDDLDRYPIPAPGKASDAQCWMGDSYYMDCVVYECDAALTCPTGWTCQDVGYRWIRRKTWRKTRAGCCISTPPITWQRVSSPKDCAVSIPHSGREDHALPKPAQEGHGLPFWALA